MELTFNVITLEWQKLDAKIQHSQSKLKPELKLNEFDISIPNNSAGLYQIYGASSIYGLDSLLYIGKSKNLKERLTQHLFKDSMISRQQNLSIRYAIVNTDKYLEIDTILEITESINIVVHKPCLNSQSIVTPYKDSLYLIQNHGERGVLNLQVTNSYWM